MNCPLIFSRCVYQLLFPITHHALQISNLEKLRGRVSRIHFITYFSEENNYKKKTFSPSALSLLMEYPWKGNVRELRNLVERLLIMCRADQISSQDLPEYIDRKNEGSELALLQIKNWKEFKNQSEKNYLQQKLKENQYNVAKTAREIGLPRSNLYQKIESLGIMIGHQQDADEESPLS